MRRRARVAAVGAAAAIVSGSALVGMPGSAVAAGPLIAGNCGTTLQGQPGQPLTLDIGGALGIPGLPQVALGTVAAGTNTYSIPGSQLFSLLGGLPILGGLLPSVCTVTVTGVNAAAGPVQDGAAAVTDTMRAAANGSGFGGQRNGPNPQAPSGGTGGQPSAGGPGAPASGGPGTDGNMNMLPESNSTVLGGGTPELAALPTSFSTGFAPMRDYSSIPAAAAGAFAPAPGLRYGGQAPGYAPQYGQLNQDRKEPPNGIQNAGNAEALPGGTAGGPGGLGLPMLIAVLALSGVTAGLLRTWVLRKTT